MNYPNRGNLDERLSTSYAQKMIAEALRGKMAGRIDGQIWRALTRAAYNHWAGKPITFGILWDLTRGDQSRADRCPNDARRMAIAILIAILRRTDLPRSHQPQSRGGWITVLSDALNIGYGYAGNMAVRGRRLLVEYGAPEEEVEAMKWAGGNRRKESAT